MNGLVLCPRPCIMLSFILKIPDDPRALELAWAQEMLWFGLIPVYKQHTVYVVTINYSVLLNKITRS